MYYRNKHGEYERLQTLDEVALDQRIQELERKLKQEIDKRIQLHSRMKVLSSWNANALSRIEALEKKLDQR